MKKYFSLLLLFIFSNLLFAQNIAFEQVGISVKPGSGSQVVSLMDEFYGNIDKPEGVNISLNYVNFKADDIDVTHFITITGSVNALAELREIRGGDKYGLYNSNMLRHAKVISSIAGTTLLRMNLEKAGEPMAQVWRWNVDDPLNFGNEFSSLIKSFPQMGYLSLGQFTHGTSMKGESHYVYMSHKDYATALGWGPKTPEQQEAFLKFQKNTSKYSTFLGSLTMTTVKRW
jgi:hypothetical protein